MVSQVEFVRQGALSIHAALCDAQRAHNNITLVDRRHPAGGKLKLVVARLVVEYTDCDQYAFFTGNISGYTQLVTELTVFAQLMRLCRRQRSS